MPDALRPERGRRGARPSPFPPPRPGRARLCRPISTRGDLWATGGRSGELLAILLDNGVKYCDPGGNYPRTCAAATSHPAGGKTPMSRPDRLDVSRIFDRFYRGTTPGPAAAGSASAFHGQGHRSPAQGYDLRDWSRGNTVILTVRL